MHDEIKEESSHEERFVLTDESNTDRINFLFSPFPLEQNVNPKHWESKLSYWRNEIHRSCRHYQSFCFTKNNLEERFSRDGKPPRGKKYIFSSNSVETFFVFLDIFVLNKICK